MLSQLFVMVSDITDTSSSWSECTPWLTLYEFYPVILHSPMLMLVDSGQHPGDIPKYTREWPLPDRGQPSLTLVSSQQNQARKFPPQRTQHGIDPIRSISRLTSGRARNAVTSSIATQEPKPRKLVAFSLGPSGHPFRAYTPHANWGHPRHRSNLPVWRTVVSQHEGPNSLLGVLRRSSYGWTCKDVHVGSVSWPSQCNSHTISFYYSEIQKHQIVKSRGQGPNIH